MDDKIPFYALDLRNISRLVKTKTKTRAQCLMVNTGSLITLVALKRILGGGGGGKVNF